MGFRRALAACGVAAVALAALATPPLRADASIEGQVLAKIRASRSGGLIVHSGLLAVARQHSMYMSRQGRMSHDNADGRIRNAPPDPAEGNGAPDDGVPAARWCENVTYSTGHPASEVASRLYSQWQGSGAHARCMRDSSRNVGAVGVHYDGTTWWATFIANVDNTPPGGAPEGSTSGPPKQTAAPKPAAPAVEKQAPAASTAPAAQPRTQPATASAPSAHEHAQQLAEASALPEDDAAEVAAGEGASAVAAADDPGTLMSDAEPLIPTPVARADYSWRELAAVATLLVLASAMLRRRVRPRVRASTQVDLPVVPTFEPLPEVERRDHVALPHVELVGAGASHA